ncbi:hypothetical protein [Halarcobacter ebronensis]|uniref:Uncharacterized protein n=1 Tax=Halarcobacter ebronensis TaxID=1462615 RepID=A0A4Q1B008_9BACT|nr:hypothetical protein [Halarcobacter ebronensis]QKF83509.1 hypothetical protein AEBR_3063 [Halarcobacter ebronensis]RXK08303.1 hypothetical protein CRV07_00415 [Halarcobacter ebronensis]
MKVFILLFFSILLLNANTINFQEKRYIDAIGQTILKKGKIEFLENQTILSYNNFQKSLIEKEGELFVKEGKTIQKLDSSNKEILKVVFLLINTIYKDNFTLLDEFFTDDFKENIHRLTPKTLLNDYIEYVEFKKSKKLDFITIVMKNQDTITIEQSDD